MVPCGPLGYELYMIGVFTNSHPDLVAIPHVCFQDDVYKGYDIPKGAVM